MSEILRQFSVGEIFRIIGEEVMAQYLADSQQQIGIDETMGKQIIHVLARIVQPQSQPSDGSALAVQFLLDQVSDMWCFVRGHGVGFQA